MIMELNFTEVIPQEGLGDLKFGMTRNEVKKLLGEPDEIENMNDIDDEMDDEEPDYVWHYDELEISISFGNHPQSVMKYIAASSPDVELWGEKLINRNFKDVLKVITQNNAGKYETQKFEEDGSTIIFLFFPDIETGFWFENDYLTEIQWGPELPE